jgi:hypothetical protein
MVQNMLKLGWAFFALCCVIVAAYALDRGIYVGPGKQKRTGPTGIVFWIDTCRYLYPSGIIEMHVDDNILVCRLFGDQRNPKGALPQFNQ